MAHENLNDAAFKGLSASRASLRVVRTDEDLKAVVESLESGTHFLLEAGEHTVTGIVRANGVEICGQTIKVTEATEDWREVFRRLARREFEKGEDAPHKKILAYDSTRKTLANESPRNEILSEAVAKATEAVVLKKMPYSVAMQRANEVAHRKKDIVYLQPTGGGYWDLHNDIPVGVAEYASIGPDGTIRAFKEEFDSQITPEALKMAEGPFMFRLNGSIVCRGAMPDLNHFAAAKSLTFKETDNEFGGQFEGEGITLVPEHRIPPEVLSQRPEFLDPKFDKLAGEIATLEAEATNKEPLSQFVAGIKSAYDKLVGYRAGEMSKWAEGKIVALASKVLGEHLPGKAKEITKLCDDLLALVAEVEEQKIIEVVFVPKANLGVPRSKMPQIKSTFVPDFVEWLKDQGVKVSRKKVLVTSLKATQKEISKPKIAKLAKPANLEHLKKPVITSRDDYLLDGHHRSMALATLDPTARIETIQVNVPIKKLLQLAGKFPQRQYKGTHEAAIDQKAVVKAAVDAAQDIHGKPDMKIIQSMVKNAISKGAKDTEDAIQIVINMMRSKEAMEAGIGKPLFSAPTKDGKGTFQVLKRNTSGMTGKQDAFSMQVVDKSGKVLKDWGSHPSLRGAQKFARNKGLIEAIDPKVKAIAGAVKQWFKKVGLKASVTAGKGKAQWIRASVRSGEIPNKYRLQAVIKVMGERPTDPDDVSFGNIQKHGMSMRAPQWSKFLGLQGVRMAASTEAEIDVDTVRQAAVNAAKDIHGKPDLKIINSMIQRAKGRAKDTEDAIQIVIDMMRAESTICPKCDGSACDCQISEEQFWKSKMGKFHDKSRWMIKFDQAVKKIVPGVFMHTPREYDNIATSFFGQGADPSKSGIQYGSRLKKRLPALAASTKTESTTLTEAGSKGLTVQQLVERIVPDDDMPDEPLQKTYIQYMRQGNVYKPFGTGTFHEKLLRQAYRLVRGMNGIEFHRAKAKTDELYRFENSVMESVIKEIDRFWDLKEDYAKFGVMHNRGILLEGPPGTGKSSVIQQIVEMMVNRGDVVFFSNRVSMVKDALHAFKEVEEERAVVVVLEDADEHIKYEQNEFLQLLDGDEAVEGVLYLATTNYVENFPPRLRRPGRFDKIVHVGPPPFEGRFVYLKNKIGEVEDDKEITRLANLTKGLSFGHLRELITAAYALKEPKDEVLKRITSKIHGGVVEAKKGRGKASVDGAEATESIVSVTIKGDSNAALSRTVNSIVDALEGLPEFCGMYTEEDNGSSSCIKVRMKNGNPKAACNLVMKALENASIPVQNLTIESYTFQPGQRTIGMPANLAKAAQATSFGPGAQASRTGADSQSPNEKRKKGKKKKGSKDPFSKIWRESEATQEALDKASSSLKFKKYVEHVKLHAAAEGHSKRIAPIRIAPYFNSNTSSTLAAKKIAETAPDDTPFSKHGAKQGPVGPAFQTDAQKPFKNWMKMVDKEVGKKVGISAQDLPDVPYADWHDDGMSPKQAAVKAIKMAKESATEAKLDPKYVAMGQKAFKQGKKAVPIHDPALSKELKKISKAGGTVKPALKAWLKGWHQANAAAPVKSGKAEADGSLDATILKDLKRYAKQGATSAAVHKAVDYATKDRKVSEKEVKRALQKLVQSKLVWSKKVEKWVYYMITPKGRQQAETTTEALKFPAGVGGAAKKKATAVAPGVEKFLQSKRGQKFTTFEVGKALKIKSGPGAYAPVLMALSALKSAGRVKHDGSGEKAQWWAESVEEGETGEISQASVDHLRQKMGSIKMTDIRDEPATHAKNAKVVNKHFKPNMKHDTVVAKSKQVAVSTVKKGYVDE